MKSKAAAMAGVVLLCAVIARPASAESPEDAVRDLVAKMKKAGDLTPLVEQVDWDSRYKDMLPEERKALGFSNAEEMKAFYSKKAQANGEDVLEKVVKDGEGAVKVRGAPDPAALVEDELDRQQGEAKSRLVNTTYSVIRSEKIGDDKYLVTVRKSYRDESEEVDVTMRLSGGRWVTDSAAALNPAPASLSGGSPIGRMPEPVSVLGQP